MTTTAEGLREKLRLLGLDSRGTKQALKERLRKHLKKNSDGHAILSAAQTDGKDVGGHSELQEPSGGPADEEETEEYVAAMERKERQLMTQEIEEKAKEERRRRKEGKLLLKRQQEERQKQEYEERLMREHERRREQESKREQEPKCEEESMRKEESKSEEAAPKATEDEPPKQAPTQEQAQKPNQKSTQEPTQEPSQGKKSRRALHKNSRYDYYLCFDVEATCEEGYSFEFPNEVIEFPVVLLDGSTLEVVDEFHSYVRPVYRPILSDFCKGLTGISQETVDDAPTFTEVLVLFQDWLKSHGIILGEGNPKKAKKSRNRGHNNDPIHHTVASSSNDFIYGASFCFVTDGPFDIRDFIGKQCLHSQIPRPSYFAQSYLDVRTLFRHYFDLIQWCNLEAMLTFLGETFTGRQHSGICDTRMVALILKRLAEGFSKKDNHPVFAERNKPLVAPQWNSTMIDKLRQGCMLKANRSTDNTYVKMISFGKLEWLEAKTVLAEEAAAAAAAEAKSNASGSGSKKSTSKGSNGKGTDPKSSDTKAAETKTPGAKDTKLESDDKKDTDGKSVDGKGGASSKAADGKGTNGKGSRAKGAGANGSGVKGTGADVKVTTVKDGQDSGTSSTLTADTSKLATSDAPEATPQSPSMLASLSSLLSGFSLKPSVAKKLDNSVILPHDIKTEAQPNTLSTPPASPPVDTSSSTSSSKS